MKNTQSKNIQSEEVKTEKKEYKQPILTIHGGLIELVQNNPSIGSDGGTGDCQQS
jgi:Fe-S cluster biogenesis protein NfuA